MKTQTQHTPGPWKVSPYYNVTSKSLTVAKVEQMPGNYESERMANAQLISACPDMFQALQAICDAFGDQDSLLIDQCKAALAKAKGEV
jgi:hypothetical protein